MSEHIVQVRKVLARGDLSGTVLTYRYGSPLEIGDRVMCPANEFSPAFIAEVTALGSDYSGYLRSLLCRVAPDRDEPFSHIRPLIKPDQDQP